MAWRKSPPELIAAFDVALPNDPRVERRKMFGYPAAFVNGHLFAGLHQDDVIVRLSESGREALGRIGGRRWEPTTGRVMREYMLLPNHARVDAKSLARWLRKSLLFAAALPSGVAKKRVAVPRAKSISSKGRKQ